MTDEKNKNKETPESKFWKAFDDQKWEPDKNWKVGGNEVNVLTGYRLKSIFDDIRKKSGVALLTSTESMTDLPILLEENKAGKKEQVRRVQVRMSFALVDTETSTTVMGPWYAEGIGESSDQHTSGSAHGMAYRNGILYHFGIVDNSDESESDNGGYKFDPNEKKTENDNVKKMMESNKLPVNEPTVTLKPRVEEVKTESTSKPTPVDEDPISNETRDRAKKIFLTAMKAGMDSVSKNNMVASYNSAVIMQRTEKDTLAWIEKYKEYEQ